MHTEVCYKNLKGIDCLEELDVDVLIKCFKKCGVMMYASAVLSSTGLPASTSGALGRPPPVTPRNW
jgi:hypothetical protein